MIRIEAPAAVMTLEEAKAHLRVDHNDEDSKIAALLLAATAQFDGPEGRLRKAIMPQTWETAFDAFTNELKLPLGPLLSVVSVTYVDGDGAEQTVSSNDYEIDRYSPDAWVVTSGSWPSAMTTINAVKVRWIAGMSPVDAPVCPPDLQAAVKLKLAELYDGSDFAEAINSLIYTHKRLVLA
jgi:uncharacterized phiE125 gp8 family phage protein